MLQNTYAVLMKLKKGQSPCISTFFNIFLIIATLEIPDPLLWQYICLYILYFEGHVIFLPPDVKCGKVIGV